MESSYLPLVSVLRLWARISLMGHRVEYGQVSTVNAGTQDAPIPLILVETPAIEAMPTTLHYEAQSDPIRGYWWVSKAFAAVASQSIFFSPQALFSIEPMSEEQARDHHMGNAGRHAHYVGKARRSSLDKRYRDALEAAGLLAAGPWTEAHEAAIAEADKAYEQEMTLTDPFAIEDEDIKVGLTTPLGDEE